MNGKNKNEKVVTSQLLPSKNNKNITNIYVYKQKWLYYSLYIIINFFISNGKNNYYLLLH